ncbi:MAG: hypothetical protein ACMUIP_07070, partial [bacterium]
MLYRNFRILKGNETRKREGLTFYLLQSVWHIFTNSAAYNPQVKYTPAHVHLLISQNDIHYLLDIDRLLQNANFGHFKDCNCLKLRNRIL